MGGRRTKVATLAVMAACAVLVGCSDDDGTNDSATAAPTQASSVATEAPATTMSPDTVPPDTVSPDTVPPDTVPPDTVAAPTVPPTTPAVSDPPATGAPTTVAPAGFTSAEVTRREDGTLAVAWTLDGEAPVDVAWGLDDTDFPNPLGTVEGEAELVVEDPAPGGRAYFRLTSGDSGITVAERRVPLHGVPNFRDLGGYPTEDGRTVRWGQVFRSGALADLTDADYDTVTDLGIKLVCDLRSDSEVEEEPDPDIGAESVRLIVNDDSVDVQAITDAVVAGDLDSISPDLLLEGMPTVATGFNDLWATFLGRVADEASRPTVVHCTAGKDRAGWASALLLRTLGVPEDVVMEDYLLTNEYLAESTAETLDQVRTIVAGVKGIAEDEVDLSNLIALLDVRPEYLQAAFDAVEEEYGSFEAFLTDGLGLSADDITALRDSMLE